MKIKTICSVFTVLAMLLSPVNALAYDDAENADINNELKFEEELL